MQNTYYTIKDTAEQGEYYLVKNSTEAQTWWIKASEDRDIPHSRYNLKPVRFFNTMEAAVNCFNRRRALYEDFRMAIEKISIVSIAIDNNGVIKSISEVSV